MSIEVRVPALPESVADATVVTWYKQPGEPVRREENLVDLETDKVVLEVPAPVAGTLGEIKVPAGETVRADTLLALIEADTVTEPAPPPRRRRKRRKRRRRRSRCSPRPPGGWSRP